ncbi:MAG: hypothetical protein H6912_05065 [Kordiimonadaceae bacterium]|nr:hypothetical protein [Kordiimonadaceae bacterium]
MRLISILLIWEFIVFPGYAQEQMKSQDDKIVKSLDLGCLPREWAGINPTETEKLFDIENDRDKYGDRISCNNHITPTEIYKFFVKVKEATRTKNREALADLIKFPISSLIDGEYEDKLNNRKIINSMVVEDRRDFIDNYENIMLPTTVKIIQCMQLHNIMSHPSQGIATEVGEIWFYPKRGTRELQIIRLSSSPEADKHWLDEKCSW